VSFTKAKKEVHRIFRINGLFEKSREDIDKAIKIAEETKENYDLVIFILKTMKEE